MNNRKWHIADAVPAEHAGAFPELDKILLQLLWNRNIRSDEDIDEFLNSDWDKSVHDPYLFRDMVKAVDIIYQNIKLGDLIYVFGDYDADGVTGAVILVSTLRKLGARVEVYLPHREREGYGINEAAVRYMADQGSKLMITCDCGVANVEEIVHAKKLCLDVIVTDHHQPKDILPEAIAIIHPTLPGELYPGKTLSGGAVAFKLVQGLLRDKRCGWDDKEKESWEKWLLDLVAISLVADMVPLTGEARALVKYGLMVLKKTRRLGLQKMYERAGIKSAGVTTYTIGWQIAPRINAAGRMDHANTGYALLMSEDSKEAEELAAALNSANTDRQRLTETIVQEALEQIGKIKPTDYAVCAFSQNWPAGLVGLVAGKLVQIFNRPALAMGSDGETIVGSGRAIEGFDLMLALGNCKDLLVRYGGHKQAAGFRVGKKNYEDFIKAFKLAAKQQLTGKDLSPVINIDMCLNFEQVGWPLYESVNKLEPTGQANTVPIFFSNNVLVVGMQKVGAGGQHWRLVLKQSDYENKFILFNALDKGPELVIGDKLDVVYDVGVNEWNGNRNLQLKIIDFKKHT